MGTRGRAACGGGRRPPLPRFGLRFRVSDRARCTGRVPDPREGAPTSDPPAPSAPRSSGGPGCRGVSPRGGRNGEGPPGRDEVLTRRGVSRGGGGRLGKRSAHTHARASGRREGNDRRRAAPGKSSGGRPRRDPAGEETRPPALSCPEASCRARPCDRAGEPVMILPQVHLRKPCYDFYFL